MRCVSCNRMLTDTERMSVKYYIDEDTPQLLVKTDIPEDMCHNCKVQSFTTAYYSNREYAFEGLTSGLCPSAGFSDNY